MSVKENPDREKKKKKLKANFVKKRLKLTRIYQKSCRKDLASGLLICLSGVVFVNKNAKFISLQTTSSSKPRLTGLNLQVLLLAGRLGRKQK